MKRKGLMNRMCASCSTKLLVAFVMSLILFCSGGHRSSAQQNGDETEELKKLEQAVEIAHKMEQPVRRKFNYSAVLQIEKSYCDIIKYYYNKSDMVGAEKYLVQYEEQTKNRSWDWGGSRIKGCRDDLLNYYCSENKYENAELLLIKLDKPYLITKFCLNKMNGLDLARDYLEKKILTISSDENAGWDLVDYLIETRAEFSRTYAEYKKWWAELRNGRIKRGPEKWDEIVDYYIHTGQIDKAIEEYNKNSREGNKDKFDFLAQYQEPDGTAMGMYYWSRRLPLSAKFQKQEEIFEKYPNCTFNMILLKEMIETAKELNENDKVIHYADILEDITNRGLESFPEPSAWSLGGEVINEKYNRAIGAVKKMDINADGLSDEMISFVLSPKGELEKGYMIPIVRIKREDTYENVFVGPKLKYSGGEKIWNGEKYYNKKDPIEFLNITGGKFLDIVVHTHASHGGEVGRGEDQYSIYRYADSEGYKLERVFSGSHAADGFESWIKRIEFIKNPDTLRWDVLKVDDSWELEYYPEDHERWEPARGHYKFFHKKKTSTYTWKDGSFHLMGETSETTDETDKL